MHSFYRISILRLRSAAIVVGLTSSLFCILRAEAQPATLDTSFNSTGIVQTNFATVSATSSGRGIIYQPSTGRIIVGGGSFDNVFDHLCVVGLTTTGALDGGFGDGGFKRLTLGVQDTFNDLQPGPNGKIIGAGYQNVSTAEKTVVAQFTADGQFDTSFAAPNGYVSVQIAGGVNGADRTMHAAVQSDGKIIVAGFGRLNSLTEQYSMIVGRLNADGTFDSTFSGNGKLVLYNPCPSPAGGCIDYAINGGTDGIAIPAGHARLRAWAVAVQADGKILLGGDISDGGSSLGYLLVRLTSAGALDTTFNGTGYRIDPFAGGLIGAIVVDDVDANGTQEIYTIDHNSCAFRIDRFTSTGAFDTTWNGTGTWTTSFGSCHTPEAMLLQADHKLVVGGEVDGNTFLARVKPPVSPATAPSLDTTGFNSPNGYISSANMGGLSRAIAFESGGKIVQVGTAVSSSTHNVMAVARYNSNGTFDTTFATPNGYFLATALTGGSYDEANGMGVDSNGKIILAGDTGPPYEFAIIRHNADAALDTTFDTDGKATVDFGNDDRAYGVAVQGDNKIVAVGDSSGASTSYAIARLTTAGALDTTFAATGKVTVDMSNGRARAVAIQTDGKVVVAGSASVGAGSSFGVVRLSSLGVLDTGFDTDGKFTYAAGGVAEARAVAVQTDGKIVVAGKSTIGNNSRITVIRLTTVGALDPGFGTSGVVNFTISTAPAGQFTLDEGMAVLVQPDGMIVVGGRTGTTQFSRFGFGIARLKPDGAFDTTFGSGGKVSTTFGSDNQDQILSMMLQYDEKVIAFGSSQTLFVDTSKYAMARYDWDNGSLDTSFGTASSGMIKFPITYNVSGNVGGFVYPATNATLRGKMHMTGASIAGDMIGTRHVGDVAPAALTAIPDLSSGTDSGRSSTDNITNFKQPIFVSTSGNPCTFENTVLLKIDAALTSPKARQICRDGTYAIQIPVQLVDLVHTVSGYTATGYGPSADTGTLSFTVDTVALPPTITSPAAGFSHDVANTLTFTGNGAENTAYVTVYESSTALCTGTADGSGNWSCSPASALPLGAHTVTAKQEDIAGNVSNASIAVSFFVKAQTTTAIAPNPTSSVYGQPVDFTATVTSTVGTPDANVTITIDATGTSLALNGSGVATLTTSSLSVATHNYSANYPGSSKYFSSSNAGGSFVVIKADTTLGVSSNFNPSVFGQSVTLTFTATAVAPGAGTPTGTVSVSIDSGAPSVHTLAGAQATLSIATLSVGNHTVDATYGGDGNFNGSSGALAGGQTVNKASTTNVLTPTPVSPVFGQSVTFTSSVTAVAPGAGTPTGDASFSVNSVASGTFALNGSSVATFTTSSLPVASHTIDSVYAGDGSFLTSTGSINFSVAKASTSVAMTPASATSVVGEAFNVGVSMSVTAPGAGTPSGSVTIGDGVDSCTVTLASGTGSCSLTLFTPGARTLTASYSGDSSFDTSSTTTGHTVNAAATITTISSHTPEPSPVGAGVLVSYNVVADTPGSGTPVGTVTVSDGVDSCNATVATGQCTITLTTPGLRTLTASFGATASYLTSSGTASHLVKRPTTTTITSHGSDPSLIGTAVLVEFTVTDPALAGTPTGTVTVTASSDSCSASVATGQCSITLNTLGPQTLSASYSGDATYELSSASLTHTVKADTTVAIDSVSPSSSVTGESVTVQYSLTVVAPGSGTPTGNVTVSDGVSSCTGTVAAGQCSVAFPNVGPRSLIATYLGDASYNGSASGSSAHQVNPAVTSIAITADTPDPSLVATTVNTTWSFAVLPPGAGAPVGSITVSDGIDSCSALIAAGGCSLTLNTLGARTLTANFGGTTDFLPSTHSVSHAVTADTTTTITGAVPASSVSGESVSVSWSVVVVAPGIGTPTGNVTVSDGTTSCVALVSAGGCTLSLPTAGTHGLTATYAGDGIYNTSASSSSPYVVAPAATTTTITSADPNPSVVGAAVPVLFSVSALSPGSGAPTGTVTVSDGVDSCSGLSTAGQCSIAFSTVGPKTLTATYAGDADYVGSSSAPIAHQVVGDTTTTISVQAPDPSVTGQPVAVTVLVAPVAPAAGTPTGSVTISGGTAPCTATLASGAATCSVTFDTAGTKSLTAVYSGDADFNGSSSPSVPQMVNPSTTTTTIDSDNPDPSVTGEAVTIQVTVAPIAPGAGIPTGNVVIGDGSISCTASLSGGSGQCALTFATTGARTITATYSGNADFSTSASSTAHAVTAAATTTSIISDDNDPSVIGEVVTIAYSVIPLSPGAGTPTGSVTISDGTISCTATVAVGQCGLTFGSAGPRTLTATYSGDVDFLSSSTSTSHTVNLVSTTTAIATVTPEPSFVGDSVVISWSVGVVAPGAGTPTGSVTASDGTLSCSAALATGQCSITFTSPGTKSLVATYSGDSTFAASSGAGVHIVSKADTTTAITSSHTSQVVVGQPVLVQFSVSAAPPAAGTPAGNVTITDGNASCIATVVAGQCSLTFLDTGARDLVATYGGDASFNGSSSSSVEQLVINHPPDAVDDHAEVAAGGSVTFNVLTNDSDRDGHDFSLTSNSSAAHGTVTCSANGTCTYSADAAFAGAELFQYQITDDFGESASATVTITVIQTNQIPVAVSNHYIGSMSALLTIEIPGVLGNDSDADGDSITAQVITPPDHGSLDLHADGSFAFTPEDGFIGDTTFTYAACDSLACSTPAPVTITLEENEGIFAVIGSTPGANNSLFKTSMHLFNGNESSIDGSIELLGTTAPGKSESLPSVDFLLAPGETRYFDDLLVGSGYSGLASANLISKSGGMPVSVLRVFNDGGDAGTTGMIEPLVRTSKALIAGDRAVLIAPADRATTRFNVGVRTLADGLVVHIIVRDKAGNVRASGDQTFAPRTLRQASADSLLETEINGSDSIEFEIIAGSGVIYGAATDNRTNDPNIQFATRLNRTTVPVTRFITVAGSTQGALGSNFKTAVQLYNPGEHAMSATLTFHPTARSASPDDPTVSTTIAPKAIWSSYDVIGEMNLSGVGSADLTTDGEFEPVAVARVFNDAGAAGQTSMTESLLTRADAISAGESATIIAPHDPSRTRFNIGFRTFEAGAVLRVTVRSANGTRLTKLDLTLEPSFFVQLPAPAHLGLALSGDESVTYEVVSGSALIYGVWTDNLTQDPSIHFAER